MAMPAKKNTLKQVPSSNSLDQRQLPYNIEAEQALLGAILIDNEAINKISDMLLAEHFYEPVHTRIYKAIHNFIERGLIASPVTLKSQFDSDEALKDIGGAGYLAKLTGLSAGILNIKHYAQIVYDLAIARNLITIGQDIVNDAFDNNLKEPAASQIEKAEHKLFNLASEGSSDKNFGHLKNSLTDAIKRAEFALKQKGEVSGVPTGFMDLDRMLGGMHDSDMLILAGRPSMGKTALAMNIALNAAKAFRAEFNEHKKTENLSPSEQKSVGVFSLEMSAEQLASRLLSMQTGLNSNNIRRGRLDQKKGEFDLLIEGNKELYELPMYIDDTPALSISAIRTRARRLKRKHNLAFLVIDYLQLIRGVSEAASSNRVQEVSEITQGLKAIAKELNIPVLALSQLSRQVEGRDDKRPQLSDLRESGSIEQDADIVIFIYREQYYLERTRPSDGTPELQAWMEKNGEKWMQSKNKAEIIISKHRNGPIGNKFLMFDSNTTGFNNLDESYPINNNSESPF